jgi:hypothetical protein
MRARPAGAISAFESACCTAAATQGCGLIVPARARRDERRHEGQCPRMALSGHADDVG